MKRIAITSTIEERKTQLNLAYTHAFNTKDTLSFIIPAFVDEIAEILTPEKEIEYQNIAKIYEENSDALVLTGGGDINPINYDFANEHSYNCNTRRDLSELYLLAAFMNAKKPIFGICRGMQLLGIYFGLPVFQQDLGICNETHNGNTFDLATRKEFCHFVHLHGKLAKALNSKEIAVNSFHHQGFTFDKQGEVPKDIEKTLKLIETNTVFNILAHTSKVIESFEHKTLPIFAVQWHPEEYENSVIIRYFLDQYVLI